MHAWNLARAAGHNPQRALAGEAVETAGEAGIAEIDIARCRGHSDRLSRVKRYEFGRASRRREIPFVQGDIGRTRSGRLQHADLDAFAASRTSRAQRRYDGQTQRDDADLATKIPGATRRERHDRPPLASRRHSCGACGTRSLTHERGFDSRRRGALASFTNTTLCWALPSRSSDV